MDVLENIFIHTIELFAKKFLCKKNDEIISPEQITLLNNIYERINTIRSQSVLIIKQTLLDIKNENISDKTKANISWIRKNTCYLEYSKDLALLDSLFHFDTTERKTVSDLYSTLKFINQDKMVRTCSTFRSFTALFASIAIAIVDMIAINNPYGLIIPIPVMIVFFSALYSLTIFSSKSLCEDIDFIKTLNIYDAENDLPICFQNNTCHDDNMLHVNYIMQEKTNA